MAINSTLITKANLSSFVAQIMAGNALEVTAPTPTGYTRQFQHTDWIDFVDPVQAGGGNGFNERFHALETEFDLISTAITSVDNALGTVEATPPAVGMLVVLSISSGATIPVPSGFQLSETLFFAFPKYFSIDLGQRANTVAGFAVSADANGLVTATALGGTAGVILVATGIAISKRGGW